MIEFQLDLITGSGANSTNCPSRGQEAFLFKLRSDNAQFAWGTCCTPLTRGFSVRLRLGFGLGFRVRIRVRVRVRASEMVCWKSGISHPPMWPTNLGTLNNLSLRHQ